MNINQHNYEAWLLDYIEGRLDAMSVLVLKDFLHHNPQLGNFDDLTSDLPELLSDDVVFGDKSMLMKMEIKAVGPVNEANYEQFFIAMHEGLLSEDDIHSINKFLLKNPFLKVEYQMYAKTKLVPDLAITYPHKSALKHRTLVFTAATYRYLVAAASVLLLIGISFNWFKQGSTPGRDLNLVSEMTQLKATEITLSLPEVTIKDVLTSAVNIQVVTSIPARLEMPETLPMLAMKKASGDLELNIFTPNREIQYIPWELQIDHELFYANLKEAGNENDRTVAGLILANTFGRVRDVFVREPAIEIQVEEQSESTRGFSLWDLASFGVQTYNILTDKDVELVTAHNENGDVVAYRFRTDRIEIARTVERD